MLVWPVQCRETNSHSAALVKEVLAFADALMFSPPLYNASEARGHLVSATNIYVKAYVNALPLIASHLIASYLSMERNFTFVSKLEQRLSLP